MKKSKLIQFAGVCFALVLTATTVFAQGWRNGNRAFENQNYTCVHFISGLTDEQITKIKELETNHQKEMNELRYNRRSTGIIDEKDEVRAEMLKKVEVHRTAVKNLLTDDQKKEYDQLHLYRNRGYAQLQAFYGRGAGMNQALAPGRGYNRCMAGRQGFGRRNAAFNGRGFGPGARGNFRAAGYGRGFGQGYWNQPGILPDSTNNQPEN